MPRQSALMRRLDTAFLLMNTDTCTMLCRTRRLLAAYAPLAWMARATGGRWPDVVALSREERLAGERLIVHLAGANGTFNPAAFPDNAAGALHGVECTLLVMRRCLEQLANYPRHGSDYHAILQAAYFDDQPAADAVLIDRLHLERSTYYQRKQEAIALYAYLLFVRQLPALSKGR